ncbi:MAG: OsmC family protein [Gemmatimonadales bacterium]|jgi:organic hydroperoxide reductase OsmC/OhrA
MTRQRHEARVSWSRGDQPFVDGRYSRRHEWTFDGGVTVAASASPHVVPVPLSVETAVDPEEALVASASSCHMLWFLSLAARRGFVVDAYVDRAFGLLEPIAPGRLAFSRVVLQPDVRFSGSLAPTAEELAGLHEAAHEACFIAASLRCEVVVASP